MLDAKYKLLMSLPDSTPLVEPMRLPRRERPWMVADLQVLSGIVLNRSFSSLLV